MDAIVNEFPSKKIVVAFCCVIGPVIDIDPLKSIEPEFNTRSLTVFPVSLNTTFPDTVKRVVTLNGLGKVMVFEGLFMVKFPTD